MKLKQAVTTVVSAAALSASSLSSAALTTYLNDFEAANAADLNAAQIQNFLANPGGTYSFPMDGTQTQVATIATGEQGAGQGSAYLNVFSNYDDGTHSTGGIVEANVFHQQNTSLADADAGPWRFQFDAKAPAGAAATNPGASGQPVTVQAFIKCFGPGFSFFFSCGTVDLVGISDSAWTTFNIDFDPTTTNPGDWDNWIVQLGFVNTSTNFDATGTYIDNFSWSKIAAAPVPVPAAAWLFGSALAGLVAARRKQK